VAFLAPFPGGNRVTRQFLANGYSGVTSAATFTFSGVSLATPAANRSIVICAAAVTSTGVSITGVSVAGLSATEVVTEDNGGIHTSIWIAALPTGTSGNVAISVSSATAHTVAFAAYAIYGNRSATPNATGASASGASGATISAPGSGVTIACALANSGGSPSWSGLAADGNQSMGTPILSFASAQIASAESLTVACGGLSGTQSFTMAAWGP